ncbi:hypothetical protein Lal_00021140 [Lupinus albus]|uniref:Putative transcription factor C2H2 family n=1 Tax=Lupinus albus TaxID=3870 RepID=A0A6A4QBB2_LUPAL|nr:putative transcription factor C2H2 family [Lupinus albus]KAF1876582.1 hypothetical protein Lal_00021140 [Lupinus albus]
MDYSAYNIQQQQQQQQQEAYNYDPTSYQIQPYNHSYSYQQYYPYSQQYPYYPSLPHTDTTYQPHLQYQPEPNPVHPPGVNPTATEPVSRTPAHVPTGPSQYRGRGGRAFRGGGRGRGRRLNGGKHFPSHAPAAAGATSVIHPSSSVSGQTPAHVPAAPLQPPSRHVQCEICKVECNTPEILEQHKNGKRHKKNMKVHEELQRRKGTNGQQSVLIHSPQLNLTYQPKQGQESEKKGFPTGYMGSEVTAINGQQSLLIPNTQSNYTATQVQENMGSEVTADNHKADKELQNNEGQTSQVPAEELAGKSTDNSAVRGRGLKRKTKGGRGGKSMRTDDGSRRRVEPPKPQLAKTFICEVCNVKCESQVVYDSHLVGKKHMARLNRVHGRQSTVVGFQTLYPSTDINALANAINVQIQQGDSDPQVLLAQLLVTLISQTQQPATTPTSSSLAATQIPASTSVAGSSNELQLSQTQTSETTSNVEMGNPSGEANNMLLSAPLLSDLPSSISALSNSITAQIQQGVSDPQVLLANLLTTILSQAQVPAIAPSSVAAQISAPSTVATQIPPSGPLTTQIPAPSSLAESNTGPQLFPAQVSEVTAHFDTENPAAETENQPSTVPLELDALAGFK